MFTNEELKIILALISLAPIKGSDALAVALLQQKIETLMKPAEPKPEEPKKTK